METKSEKVERKPLIIFGKGPSEFSGKLSGIDNEIILAGWIDRSLEYASGAQSKLALCLKFCITEHLERRRLL